MTTTSILYNECLRRRCVTKKGNVAQVEFYNIDSQTKGMWGFRARVQNFISWKIKKFSKLIWTHNIFPCALPCVVSEQKHRGWSISSTCLNVIGLLKYHNHRILRVITGSINLSSVFLTQVHVRVFSQPIACCEKKRKRWPAEIMGLKIQALWLMLECYTFVHDYDYRLSSLRSGYFMSKSFP